MNTDAKIGVFLCKCGNHIEPLVDLQALKKTIAHDTHVAHCEVLPNPCQQPGIDRIITRIVDKQLNRLVIAGCEGRLMLKSIENQLAPLELHKGQIDMVNVRGHVAAVSDLEPGEKARKAAKLIKASVAEMAAMKPSIASRVCLEGPVMIVGGGVASFTAAQELGRQGVDYLLAFDANEPMDVVDNLYRAYPGEYPYHDRLTSTIQEAINSPHATVLPPGRLSALAGVTGKYTLTFTNNSSGEEQKYAAGAIISCLDASLESPGPEFGHDGQSVLIQPELEVHMRRKGIPKGSVVFWISDYESGQSEFAVLSARSAWSLAAHIADVSSQTRIVILYNEQMEIPLTAAERSLNRKLGIYWVPYDKNLRPAPTDHYISFCNLSDRLEHELQWDYLVLSPKRTVAGETLRIAKILGLVHKEGRFLTGHHARVRPEMVGREETYLAGSARYPCDLHEALTQGRRAARKTAEMYHTSAAGELFVPRVVCVVDPTKCIGCGLCQDLCDCGGIGVEEGLGGGLPRVVDPMVCTGGGTCAAACPYHALVLQNNTTAQREARVARLASMLSADEILTIACAWGGLPAADLAGKLGLKYDPRVHLLGVPCVGQIDPCVMVRAFKEGASSLLLIGCLPEECHHSAGIDHAWSRVNTIKKMLTKCGFDRRRIALAHADLNQPKEFIRTVESFSQLMAALGPIEKSPENQAKLDAMYNLIKYNTRIRHLLTAGLRRTWENVYRGERRHLLDYDRDFSTALVEELMQQRLIDLLRKMQRPLNMNEMAGMLQEDPEHVWESLRDMISNQTIDLTPDRQTPLYALSN